MSAISKNTPWCEVYIWLGRDPQGEVTTASSGGVKSELDNLARCGHASLGIFDGTKIVYISLWPARSGATFVQSLEEDRINEGGCPDSIIRLHHLNIPQMLKAFGEVIKRQQEGKIRWVMESSNDQDITNPKNTTANCASCAYSILKSGGLTDPSSKYSRYVSGKGPNSEEFYSKVKCDAGVRANGIFDGAPWTNSNFTPKGLLLRVASAAEAYLDDVRVTTEIMHSNRVTPTNSNKTDSKEQKKLQKKT